MKKVVFSLFLSLILISCTNQKVTIIATPQMTATSIVFDSSIQDISDVVDELFNLSTCSKKDLLNDEEIYHYSVDHPLLIEISKSDLEKVEIKEIADSKNGSYRSYLVDEPSPNICGSCLLSRVYIEDKENKHFYKIDWKGYDFTRYISNLIWVGDSILAMRQANNSNTYEIYGVNVDLKEFVYFSVISCPE